MLPAMLPYFNYGINTGMPNEGMGRLTRHFTATAAMMGDLDTLVLMRKHNAVIDRITACAAAYAGHEEIVKYCLTRGVCLDMQMVLCAAAGGRADVMIWLLRKAFANVWSQKSKRTHKLYKYKINPEFALHQESVILWDNILFSAARYNQLDICDNVLQLMRAGRSGMLDNNWPCITHVLAGLGRGGHSDSMKLMLHELGKSDISQRSRWLVGCTLTCIPEFMDYIMHETVTGGNPKCTPQRRDSGRSVEAIQPTGFVSTDGKRCHRSWHCVPSAAPAHSRYVRDALIFTQSRKQEGAQMRHDAAGCVLCAKYDARHRKRI